MSRLQCVFSLVTSLALVFIFSCAAWAVPVALSPSATSVANALSVVYDPETGRISATPPQGSMLTALELRSAASAFTGACDNLGGPFDVCAEAKVFKLATDGFTSVDFGQILPPGLTGDYLLADLTVDGATKGGGFEIGSGRYLVHPEFVPEPLSATLWGLGMILLSSTLRGRSRT